MVAVHTMSSAKLTMMRYLQLMYNMEIRFTAGVYKRKVVIETLQKEGNYFPALHASTNNGAVMEDLGCQLNLV